MKELIASIVRLSEPGADVYAELELIAEYKFEEVCLAAELIIEMDRLKVDKETEQ